MSSRKQKGKSMDHLVFALCLVGQLAFHSFSDYVYFRDYSITFEGAYRVSIGQIPFRDFYMPIGPVSFVIPAVFFKLFGSTWSVFLLSQQFENALMLLLLSVLLRKLEAQAIIRWASLITFTVCYLLLLSHPWYNSTGVLILLAATICALQASLLAAMLAGVHAGLAVLTKQDFGLITILIAGFLIGVVSLGSNLKNIVPNLNCITDRDKLRNAAIRLAVFVTAATVVVATFVVTSDPHQFKFWFNYGQAPHELRSLKLHDVVGYPFGLFGWSMAILAVFQNNLKLLIAAIFILAATISRTTSGLIFTHYYFMGFVPLLINECWNIKFRWRPVLMFFVLYTSLRIASSPFRDSYHALQASIHSQPIHYGFEQEANILPMVRAPDTLRAFSAHTQMPQQTADLLFYLKKLAADKRAKSGGDYQLKVLNLTELTPIYTELEAPPPTGLPLWFHSKVSLFPEQVTQLNRVLSEDTFDIILLQGTHEGLTKPYLHFLSVLKDNRAYVSVGEIKNTPANATYPCEPSCQGQIFIFSKK